MHCERADVGTTLSIAPIKRTEPHEPVVYIMAPMPSRLVIDSTESHAVKKGAGSPPPSGPIDNTMLRAAKKARA